VDVSPGRKFGRYEIEALLGQGGMGRVFRAVDTVLERPVALKIILPDRAEREEALARFFREAKLAAKITHPNAVQVYDLGETDGVPFIAMELVEGVSLVKYIGDQDTSAERKMRWMLDVARALAAAHAKKLLHRDVKPGNIIISTDGTPKLADFGLAKRTETTPALRQTFQTELGFVVGTPAYMAPEQLEAEEGIDGRADQFAWALTSCAVVLGHNPRARDPLLLSPIPLLPELPRRVSELVLRALSNDRDMRFPTMDELVKELWMALEGARSIVPAAAPTPRSLARTTARMSSVPPPPRQISLAAVSQRVVVVPAQATPKMPLRPIDDQQLRQAASRMRVLEKADPFSVANQEAPRVNDIAAEKWEFSTKTLACPARPILKAAFTPDGACAAAVGRGGVAVLERGSWSVIPVSVDVDVVRGVKMLEDGGLVLAGTAGFAAVVGRSGRLDALTNDQSVSFSGVDVGDAGHPVFVGGRAGGGGVVGLLARGRLEIVDVEIPLLHVVCGRLILAAGQDELAIVLRKGIEIACTKVRASAMTGVGGDEAFVATRFSIVYFAPLASMKLEEAIEHSVSPVVAVAAADRGEAWAVDQRGGLHRRASLHPWVRVAERPAGDAPPVAMWAARGRIRVLRADGSLLDGHRVA